MVETEGDRTPEAEAGPLTTRIFARFSETLFTSKKFDPETVRQLVELGNGEAQPKAAEIEKLLQQEERLE